MSLSSLLSLYFQEIKLEDGREALIDKSNGEVIAYRS